MQICRRRSQWIDPIRAQAGAQNLRSPLLLLAITHFLMTSSSSRQYVSSYSARRTLRVRRILFSCDKCYLFLCTALHASFALCAYFRNHMRFFISAFRLLHHPTECYETYALTYLWGFSPYTVFRRVLKLMTSNYLSFCMSAKLRHLKTKYWGRCLGLGKTK
jgi:hypothetical protein